MKQKTVLVVDDDQGIRETLITVFKLYGYEAMGAENGKEAIKVLDHLKLPCVIVLDLMMPVMDGCEFSKYVKGRIQTQKIPIIMLTAFGDQLQKLRPQVDLCLKKPFELEVVLNAVSSFCQ